MKDSLQDLVSAQAERTPANRAIVFNDEEASYAELEERSNRLARLLRAEGCKSGDRVALFVPKSIEAIVGMLGVLKAGCAYVPIDLESPTARVRRIFDACEPAAALVSAAGSGLLDDCVSGTVKPVRIVSTAPHGTGGDHFQSHIDFSGLDAFDSGRLDAGTAGGDLAHLLFTSGSTGTPKGVMITHGNVLTFIDWATRYFATAAEDQISGHPPLHFDLSTFDIFGSLSRGATLHLVPPELSLMAPQLADWIRTSRLTQWFSVPSILTYMAKFNVLKEHDLPEMKRLLWCGEVLPTPTLRYWMERLPHVSFTNLYGPTEATIASSFYTVERPPADEREDIPIGSPCEGEELLLVEDGSLKPARPGSIGEICIRGAGLSPGYWRDPDKTSQVFLADPDEPSARVYRTGDLGRIDERGLFHYIGRTDSQIKSRGHRIELGEIETALNGLGCLQECAVVGVETGGFEGTMICCAYASDPHDNVTPVTLRQQLSSIVPRYMLPSRWHSYDRLPKNANGKIDRSKIRQTFAGEASERAARSPEASTSTGVAQ